MPQFKQVFLSWLRASLASVGALWMAGTTDPKALGFAAISGLDRKSTRLNSSHT